MPFPKGLNFPWQKPSQFHGLSNIDTASSSVLGVHPSALPGNLSIPSPVFVILQRLVWSMEQTVLPEDQAYNRSRSWEGKAFLVEWQGERDPALRVAGLDRGRFCVEAVEGQELCRTSGPFSRDHRAAISFYSYSPVLTGWIIKKKRLEICNFLKNPCDQVAFSFSFISKGAEDIVLGSESIFVHCISLQVAHCMQKHRSIIDLFKWNCYYR